MLWILMCCLGPGASTTPAPPRAEEPSAPAPVAAPTVSEGEPAIQSFNVYFARSEYVERGQGEPLAAVQREAPAGNVLQAALDALYAGPFPAELEKGLALVSCGTEGARLEEVRDGTAFVTLEGRCGGCGAFGIFELLHETLVQFPEAGHVHVREEGAPFQEGRLGESVRPPCLEP